MGVPHPTLGVDSEGSAVFRDTVFEAFRRLAPFSLPPDRFASHDDVGEAIVVHARDAAGVVEDALHHSYCTLILITMRSHQSYHNITTVIHSCEYSTTVDNSTIETYRNRGLGK